MSEPKEVDIIAQAIRSRLSGFIGDPPTPETMKKIAVEAKQIVQEYMEMMCPGPQVKEVRAEGEKLIATIMIPKWMLN
jgi:hypothetical protein